MTEVMGEKERMTSVHKVCTARAPFLHATLCVLAVSASGAQADGLAWDRFVKTCLAPMTDSLPVAVGQLVPIETPDWVMAKGAAYESLTHEPRLAMTYYQPSDIRGARVEIRQTLKES